MNPERWQRIKRIAGEAFELAGDARAAYLRRECGDDAELRTEVERLVREHERPSLLPDVVELISTPAAPSLLTKAGGAAPPSTAGELASEVVRRAGERLGLVGLAYACGFFAVHVLNEVLVHGASGTPYGLADHWPSLVVAALAIAGGLTLYLRIRQGRVRQCSIIRTGLLFEVVGGFGMALADYAMQAPQAPTIMGPLWMCVWLVAFPLVVPAPPRQATAAALATATTGPAAMAVGVAAGVMDWPPAGALVAEFGPVFFCAVLASILGRVVYRMGTELRRAQQLGSYQLESLIGRGGMGEVWVARHRMLARPAALKLIRPEVLWQGEGAAGAIQRFELEARNTAALTSPHTIELYDYGTTEEGVFFYAMELLDGLDLDSLVRRFGALPPGRAIHFLEQICQSLAEAHERGLVHRDIKPANVYACRQGLEVDFVKVLDFGLVTRHGEEAPAGAAGGGRQLIGTPGYLAPESILSGEVGPRTDLYAVGCVAYWLLTGGPVFVGDSTWEVLTAHVEAEPPAPSERAPRALSKSLDALVLACLTKDPAERPESALALRDRLLVEGREHPWSQPRARAWWSERMPPAEGA